MEDDNAIAFFDIGKRIGFSLYHISSALDQIQSLKDSYRHIEWNEIIANLEAAYDRLEEI